MSVVTGNVRAVSVQQQTADLVHARPAVPVGVPRTNCTTPARVTNLDTRARAHNKLSRVVVFALVYHTARACARTRAHVHAVAGGREWYERTLTALSPPPCISLLHITCVYRVHHH